MKSILIVLLSLVSIMSYAQHDVLISKLILTTNDGLQQQKEVTFDNRSNSLHVGECIIPVSKNTLVNVDFENGHYEVEFSLQKGTAIRSTADSNWRRASFALSFKSRKAAKNFIHSFREVTEKEYAN